MPSCCVLHLIPSFAIGGSERQLGYLAPALAALGHDVRVAHVHDGPNLERFRDTSIRVHRLRCRSNHDPRLLVQVASLIRTINPDLVQTWLPQMDVLGGMASWLRGVPWVLSERSSAAAYAHGWKAALRRFVGATATAVAANSPGGLAYWQSGSRDRLVRVIHNIVPVDEIENTTGLPTDMGALGGVDELVMSAGRLDTEKNVSMLLRAFDLLLSRRPRAHAVIFGNGPMAASLAAEHRTLGNAARIHLRPFTPELWRWMKHASVFVSLSRFEGSPNAVLEAMASGCPLVLSDIPAHHGILPADCAAWCSPEIAQEAATSIGQVLSDREQGRAMAGRAHARLGDWTAARIAREYATLYEDAIARWRPETRATAFRSRTRGHGDSHDDRR